MFYDDKWVIASRSIGTLVNATVSLTTNAQRFSGCIKNVANLLKFDYHYFHTFEVKEAKNSCNSSIFCHSGTYAYTIRVTL